MPKKSTELKVPPPSPALPAPDLVRAEKMILDLLPIPGKSGEEGKVAEFIRQQLLAAGADEKAITFDNANRSTLIKGEIGNLIFKLPGTKKAPRRMLSAHMDTVPICVGCQPVVDGDFVKSANPATGLGGDDRAGAATVLTAALEILRQKLPHPPLTFCWFIQEEIGLQGSRCLQVPLLGKPAMAFNWDGGAPEKLTIGATGGYRMEIKIDGQASHAGVAPERGISAIAIASIAIAELQRNGWHGLVVKGKNRGTSNVGFIHGGEATNVVTDLVTLKAEARSHDPTFRAKLIKEIEQAFHRAAKEVKNSEGKRGKVTIEGRLDYESFQLAEDAPCVQLAGEAARAIGREPIHAISNGGVDANWTNLHGIPTVTLGCGQKNVHMTSEMLDLPMYRDACRIALHLATA
ncbi:M20/M25/M40 family metallo-hydrolase [Anatilimnocola sp. NA78]|uniref:M20/M25/M40 family metallo-hydrolase n=1 Tax=Anatilimnocola sp. NA78 TaxID=3415683 RepID=UPI003CE4C65E